MSGPRNSLAELNRVLDLSDQGRYNEVVEALADRSPETIERSPTLALHYGIAHGRLGRYEESARWVDASLSAATAQGDRVLEARALNARGAIALESGRPDEAERFFDRALAEAKELSDHGTMGRCCNNLGIISNLRGQHAHAAASYTLALAAYQQAGSQVGVATTEHNLRLTYRDLGQLDQAFKAADRAVDTAQAVGNQALAAYAMVGRAEIRTLAGEPEVAQREVLRALAIHRELGDVVWEADDLRVLALTQTALGELTEAEHTYRDVLERAEVHHRPLLAADAGRDLAHLLADQGRGEEARAAAEAARECYSSLGAVAEIRQLDEFIATRLD